MNISRIVWRLAETGELIIVTLRDGAFWLCRFPALRSLTSPTYVWLRDLYNWYWGHVL